MKHLFIYITFLIILITTQAVALDNHVYDYIDNTNDSIPVWIKYAKKSELTLENRLFFLDKAYEKALLEKNDSLRNKYLSKIAVRYSRLNDSSSFRRTNKLTIQLSIKLKDSLRLAFNYWDLGSFFGSNKVNDSAYYNYFRAQKIFNAIGDNHASGRMLLNMAICQSELRDYTGSEVTTIRALKILEPLGKEDQLYKCYTNLGVVFNELHEYGKALKYHNKALEYQNQFNGDGKDTNFENTLNNIGVVYANNEQYEKARDHYIKALRRDDLKNENTKLYAKLLDNLAYSKFKLNDTIGVVKLFKESLHTRDSINDVWGKSMSLLHMAEYYDTNNDTIKAFEAVKEAKKIAEKSKNYRDILKCLILLYKLDAPNKDQYTQQYIALSETLQEEERAIRDKFARIQFETDHFIEENEALEGEKDALALQQKNILIVGSIILVLGMLIYIIRDQRLKNIRLKLEKEQQLANEEIYNLMLTQQNKIDEGKRNEKKRMSEELHDGVLGNLYGIKMNLAVLNAQNNSESVIKREAFIEGLSKVIDEIRNVSHELHANAIDANVGYVQLIEDLLSEKSLLHGYAFKLLADDTIKWTVIKGDIKMNIYRIIQEAVQNINKYAKANNLNISINSDGDFIYVSIIDDGIGFNTSTNKDGIGIKNIRSRVERLNGFVEFISELKKGTTINIKIPF
ncbi:tetratricopeptide repeat protein [Aureibaculum sp. A20]|uniref:Oxygen sensor histidine kinase NreB n=1 Tax=Aureibaculum flavum TaxID=2795986 RepID=A0ABS0WWU1_9FLAO|nr:tetratricopeptide repeat-containing sensor histidine kinase [Aureibaculum flavum]MBJ2176313.1 tetratricopeptide repeat protein [Aureibaculum flavum]